MRKLDFSRVEMRRHPDAQVVSKDTAIETINERIEKLILYFSLGKQKFFAEKLGVAASTISNIIGERKTEPGSGFIMKLLNAYPTVNPDWLLTGRGEMLRTEVQKANTIFGEETVKRLTEELERERREKTQILQQNDMLLQLLGKQSGEPAMHTGHRFFMSKNGSWQVTPYAQAV